MARSYFYWLIIYEDASSQIITMQTAIDILQYDGLTGDLDSIIAITRMDLVN